MIWELNSCWPKFTNNRLRMLFPDWKKKRTSINSGVLTDLKNGHFDCQICVNLFYLKEIACQNNSTWDIGVGELLTSTSSQGLFCDLLGHSLRVCGERSVAFGTFGCPTFGALWGSSFWAFTGTRLRSSRPWTFIRHCWFRASVNLSEVEWNECLPLLHKAS